MIRCSEHRSREVDCLILGAGITGAGVARDAALRGLSTVVVDSHDFASGTSHLSSKLVHGGFRYLEHLHFRLVWEGIVERERLMRRVAPNLMRPLKFVLPFRPQQRLKWLLAVCVSHLYGLPQWLHSGRRSGALIGSRLRREYPMFCGPPLGVAFWDAQTNDARLVISALRTAERHGATLWNYAQVAGAFFADGAWNVSLRTEDDPWDQVVRAKTLVNATGPWSSITAKLLNVQPAETLWVKGSHILLRRPRAFGDDAIIIRSVHDGRPLWAVPWENRLLVGSTESSYSGDLRQVRPTADEVSDLFLSVEEAFPRLGLTREDIRCAYAGVRPIVHQAVCSENRLSRRHQVRVDRGKRLITVSGGKLTTFRRMGEQAVDQIDQLLRRPSPTPGMRRSLRNAVMWPGLSESQSSSLRVRLGRRLGAGGRNSEVLDHLVRIYGNDASRIVDDMIRQPQWGRPLVEDLPYCIAELAYLCRTENVRHLLDLVKRRTPLYFLVDDCGMEWLPGVVEQLAPILGWNADRCAEELASVVDELNQDLAALGRSPVTVPQELSLVACA